MTVSLKGLEMFQREPKFSNELFVRDKLDLINTYNVINKFQQNEAMRNKRKKILIYGVV